MPKGTLKLIHNFWRVIFSPLFILFINFIIHFINYWHFSVHFSSFFNYYTFVVFLVFCSLICLKNRILERQWIEKYKYLLVSEAKIWTFNTIILKYACFIQLKLLYALIFRWSNIYIIYNRNFETAIISIFLVCIMLDSPPPPSGVDLQYLKFSKYLMIC